ncbi:MAG: type II secretion system protein [Pseudohongiellaceae bacterium]|nr:type II secretion system protein [Pseudohongiellaceae bacterium]
MNTFSYRSGFTLVEMVITILLIGIVSAVALSRMLSADAYNAINVREGVISAFQMAQQRAIGHADVVLTFQPDGDELSVLLEGDGAALVPETRLPLASVTIAAEVDVLDACDTISPDSDNILSDVKPLIVEFDALGDMLSSGVVDGNPANPVDVNTGMRICINEDPVMSLCISKLGYAYAGACDD